MDKYTVVIRNRNEEEYIGFAIQSVIDYLPNSSILILDNNSTDNSLEIVNMFIDRINIDIVNVPKYSPGTAINIASQNIHTENTLLLSAHCQITELDLPYLEKKLKKYGCVFGKQIPIYKGKKITPRYIWSHFTDNEEVNMYSNIENRYFLHNAFCFYTTSVLQVNKIDENLSGKEDRYWAKDYIDHGKSYLYTPKLKCNHFYTSNGNTWKGL